MLSPSMRRKPSLLTITALLVIISTFTFHKNVFAGSKETQAEEYRSQGLEQQQKGNLETALTFYTKAVELGLENAAVFNDLGVLYEQFNLGSKAEDYYLKALKFDPQYLPTYTNLGYFYKQSGSLGKAEQFFRKRYLLSAEEDPWKEKMEKELLQIDPRYKDWFTALAAEKLNEEMVRRAQEEFYDKLNRSAQFFKNGQLFYEQCKYEEAIEEYDHALELMPDSPKILAARDQASIDLAKQEIQEQSDRAVQMIHQGEYIGAKDEIQEILTTLQNKPNLISEYSN